MTTISKLSDKITGNDYFSAHRSRMQVNNDYFIEIAKELTAMGFTVYYPKNGLIGFIRIENADNQCYFGFGEVPYNWYISCDIDYRLKHGSGKTLSTEYDYNKPFTSDQIISYMQPKVPVQVPSNRYLTLFTI